MDLALITQGHSLKSVINWANIMFYDLNAAAVGSPDGITLHNYKEILGFFEIFLNKDQIVMGFEPGSHSMWPGMDVSKSVVDYIQWAGYGGVQFWAINESQKNGNAKNTKAIATYAKEVFGV